MGHSPPPHTTRIDQEVQASVDSTHVAIQTSPRFDGEPDYRDPDDPIQSASFPKSVPICPKAFPSRGPSRKQLTLSKRISFE